MMTKIKSKQLRKPSLKPSYTKLGWGRRWFSWLCRESRRRTWRITWPSCLWQMASLHSQKSFCSTAWRTLAHQASLRGAKRSYCLSKLGSTSCSIAGAITRMTAMCRSGSGSLESSGMSKWSQLSSASCSCTGLFCSVVSSYYLSHFLSWKS